MKEKELLNEKLLLKILRNFFFASRIKVKFGFDEDIKFSPQFVTVYTQSAFPLRNIVIFGKYMKVVYDLDCCDFHFDLGAGYFCFEMF